MFEENFSFRNARMKQALFDFTTFKGKADFNNVRIWTDADFSKAKFMDQADFNNSKIEGDAIFYSNNFERKVNFSGVRINGAAKFDETNFKQRVNFNCIQINSNISFINTVFKKNVAFQNAFFKSIFFEKNGNKVQFLEKIDLRGCIYDRIYPISFWEQLIKNLDPYDQQPFKQLEETFRSAGLDKLANDVYYQGRKRRSKENITIRDPFAWLSDYFLRFITGYGVRLKYLSFTIALILIIGTVIFHNPGAVTLVKDSNYSSISPQDSYLESFWVSLNTFLPIEISCGADWIPSHNVIWSIQTFLGVFTIKYITFASLMKLIGWILVPVGIAGISGILKR